MAKWIVLCLVLWSVPNGVCAEAAWGVSPGVKLGWTVGGQGFTFGVEVSVIRLPDLDLPPNTSAFNALGRSIGTMITKTWGIVLNLDTNFKDAYSLRVGAEWVGPFVGVEAGPAWIVDKRGSHLGLGITPWLGYYLFGYFTYTLIFDGSPNQEQAGIYLKTPLLGACDGDCHDDWN